MASVLGLDGEVSHFAQLTQSFGMWDPIHTIFWTYKMFHFCTIHYSSRPSCAKPMPRRRYLACLLPILIIVLVQTNFSGQTWSVAAWNQHRKSSYYQKDCVWMSQLLQQGHSQKDIMAAIDRLQVYYSPQELQRWVADHDLVAVQEADPSFLGALGDPSIIRGADDRDGRGIQVESCTALILPKAHCVRRENAVLQFRVRKGTVSRDHSIALVEDGKEGKGQRLVVCSLHLHPPDMILQNGGHYGQYLEPLRQAVESLAGVEDGLLQTPCLLLGDFNVSPEHFQQLTSAVDFWRQFHVVQPSGGSTAHRSNPCSCGDFALAAGGTWRGRALGSDDFRAFENHAERVVKVLGDDIMLDRYKKAEQCCQEARNWLLHLPSDAESQQELPLKQLSNARVALQSAIRKLGRRPTLRRTLLNSDHRPLCFDSIVQSAKKPRGKRKPKADVAEVTSPSSAQRTR
eukprot:s2911_g7.t1